MHLTPYLILFLSTFISLMSSQIKHKLFIKPVERLTLRNTSAKFVSGELLHLDVVFIVGSLPFSLVYAKAQVFVRKVTCQCLYVTYLSFGISVYTSLSIYVHTNLPLFMYLSDSFLHIFDPTIVISTFINISKYIYLSIYIFVSVFRILDLVFLFLHFLYIETSSLAITVY